jgi:hypothetical protein
MSQLLHTFALVGALIIALYLLGFALRVLVLLSPLIFALSLVAGGLWLIAQGLGYLPSELLALIPAALMGWCVWLFVAERRGR